MLHMESRCLPLDGIWEIVRASDVALLTKTRRCGFADGMVSTGCRFLASMPMRQANPVAGSYSRQVSLDQTLLNGCMNRLSPAASPHLRDDAADVCLHGAR